MYDLWFRIISLLQHFRMKISRSMVLLHFVMQQKFYEWLWLVSKYLILSFTVCTSLQNHSTDNNNFSTQGSTGITKSTCTGPSESGQCSGAIAPSPDFGRNRRSWMNTPPPIPRDIEPSYGPTPWKTKCRVLVQLLES